MRDFDYLVPETLEEAVETLAAHGETCRVIAGGTALLLALRQRMVAPTHLVSLARIRALRGIVYDANAGLRIGACTLHADLARSRVVQNHYPMLADVAGRLANPQVRNQGTIGGNLCYGDPTTDPPTTLVALDASVLLQSPRGARLLALTDFLLDFYATALAPDELLVEIRLPPPRFTTSYHARFHRTAAEHRPLVNMAVALTMDGDRIAEARIVVGASTRIPTRTRAAELFLQGRSATTPTCDEAADLVAREIEPLSDIRGDAAFRRDMVRVVAKRTLFALGTAPVREDAA